jgi:hypothetical protein
MVFKIEKSDSERIQNGDQERSVSQRSNVMSKSSDQTCANWTLLGLPVALTEIPNANGRGNDKLSQSSEEGMVPQNSKDVVDKTEARETAPMDLGEGRDCYINDRSVCSNNESKILDDKTLFYIKPKLQRT